ncbi:MAG: hypothetical protein KC505_11280 [Myxococcales bacterium]|nr:hypothetical protein [Myxococcales bacterium]
MFDKLIVATYMITTLIIGLYVGRKTDNIRDYAIGKRNFSDLVLVSAVFASVIDASSTIGLAGNTFILGPIFLFSYFGIVLSRFTLAFFIAPKMKPFLGKTISSGDIFEKLYGRRAKTLMGISTIIETTLMAGAQVLAISHLIQFFFGVEPTLAAIGASVVIIGYSFRGGIRSVTATDVFQFGILIIAIPILCGFAITKLGGLSSFLAKLGSSGLSFQSEAKINFHEHISVFLSFALPCLYPVCIQRMLMAKNPKQIKTAFIINGMLSIPFYILVGVIGICAHYLLPNINHNIAIPAIIDSFLPFGFKGIVIAGMLAIFMSTADSILNIGAIAITHDLIGSLRKKPLTTSKELFLVRISSIFIALGAITIALRFSNVLDVIFLIMVLGNSVFFPGYLLGILGYQGSKKAFWIGVTAGVATVIIGIGVLNIFMLHVMLVAIAANCAIHIIENIVTKQRAPFALRMVASSVHNQQSSKFAKYFLFNNWVKNQDYCSIFAVCSIAISIFPFFHSADFASETNTSVLLVINGILAVMSFLILFRELWWTSFVRNFSVIWALLLVISLPLQTFLILFWSNMSTIWLIDAVVMMPLLYMLTSRKGVIYTSIAGLMIASAIYYFTGPLIEVDLNNFAQWTLFLHSTVLTICLVLFRKRDVEICKSTSSTLLHEANRSLSTFEAALSYMDAYIPELVLAYNAHVPESIRKIAKTDLQELERLPKILTESSKSTSLALQNLLNRVQFYSSGKKSSSEFFINECIEKAIDSAHFIKYRNIFCIDFKNNIGIRGEPSLIIQSFINLIENAITAIEDSTTPSINILVKETTVTIKDNGCGITPSNLPNIFDELFTTKESHNSGLGLAFCKQAVIEHGGIINCRSKPNFGTTFEIFFPNSRIIKEI